MISSGSAKAPGAVTFQALVGAWSHHRSWSKMESMAEIDIDVPEIELMGIGRATLAPGTVHEPFRFDDRVEVSWVIAGSTHITSNDATYDLGPRSAFYLPPGRHNQYRFNKETSTTACFAVFRMTDPPPECVLRRLSAGDVSWVLLEELLQLDRHRPPHWKTLAENVLRYLVWSLLVGDWVAGGPALTAPIERMIELVRHRWQTGVLRSPTLSELAAAAEVAPSHLCKVVQRATGHSPIAALRLIRIDRAAMLLRHTSIAVGRIAKQTGFESGFHFSRVFATVTGSSPTAYRSGTMHYELSDGLRRISARL
jgi:AraC-like DNA-binding protein